jgi:hypothetical protein
LKDLQQLQKQTIAVLESVKSTLDDIQQVLRSPEATRGMEKQQNAATLLAKGFVREAVEQAQGAVGLLPANPEAHLLLALSLAADRQVDGALAVARKGLLLVDRRQHPLAIECGLLHAMALLGCGSEALDRWSVIIESLPLPVLFKQMGRIAACFPRPERGVCGEELLDELITRRLMKEEDTADGQVVEKRGARAGRGGRESGRIHFRADEIPAGALFAALDAAKDFDLANTHRALLGQVARRLQLAKEPGEVVKFLTECVVAVGNRGLDRSTRALGRAVVKRLLKQKADVMMLHRAMGKLEMAGSEVAHGELKGLLKRWRREANLAGWAKGLLAVAMMTLIAGGGIFAYTIVTGETDDQRRLAGPVVMLGGSIIGLMAGAVWSRRRGGAVADGRAKLTREERAYLNSRGVRESLR